MSHPCIPWLLLPPTQLLPASHPGWMPTGMAGELPEAAGSQGSWMESWMRSWMKGMLSSWHFRNACSPFQTHFPSP